MKSNSPVKIIVGVFTSWIVISPFLLVAFWFLFVLTIATIAENQVQSGSGSDLVILFLFLILVLLTILLNVGLQIFYLVHIVPNTTGRDVFRPILGIGMFLFSIIAMPVYYFINILSEPSPQWALSSTTTMAGSASSMEKSI